jgi:putative ABC transport system permease protein
MSFDIAGQTITAPITSMRKLDWGSMQVNFFVIFPPEALKSFPQSWITSYHQAKNLDSLDIQLAQRYPNLTIVDIDNSLRQIQEVLNRLANALGLLLLPFVLPFWFYLQFWAQLRMIGLETLPY